MTVTVVIPNYNGEEILKKNLPVLLRAVENYKNGKIDVVIVDDCSGDNSIQVVEEFIKENKNLTLIKSENNKGFSTNVNKGVKAAAGEIVVLLNTDVIANNSFLVPLLEHFSDESVFAVGCMNESVEDGKIVLRGRGIGKWEKGFLMHRAGDLEKNNTLWISGGSGAFRKKIWDKLNGLDEIYDPFYWEDIDISYGAQRAGFKALFEKRSVVRHEHEKGAIKSKYTPIQVKRIAYRNQFIFVWKNGDLDKLLSNFLWLPYHLFNGLKGDKALVLGFFDALLRLPRVLNSRANARKNFIISDKEVLSRLSS